MRGERNVFFFVSGGVDSSVAFALCMRALGPDRVRGVYVDTGLMREGETDFVRRMPGLSVEHAEEQFLGALAGVTDPEQKRHIIGEEFVRVQERIIESRRLLDEHWILGQGTIYPDTIESGGTGKAAVIKTHHNRVAGIQKLIECGRIVEPLKSFYKDEVREVGASWGCRGVARPASVSRAGPGDPLPLLGFRRASAAPPRRLCDPGEFGRRAGRRPELRAGARDRQPGSRAGYRLINRLPGVNRVIAGIALSEPLPGMQVCACSLTPERIARLREADAVVRRLTHASGYDRQVWQFPVILIPLGTGSAPDSVVLRPVDSVDGMTAQSVMMPVELREKISAELLGIPGVAGVFYDLTHKPPGTIEWE